MLDFITYRMSESLAKASLPAWQLAQTHNVDHFEKVGFPVRVDGIQGLGPLLDTMQENRFEKYMRELGGLTANEYATMIAACHDAVLFQLKLFPARQPRLPASTLLSMFCLYKKLLGIDPDFRSVLEIGPGCGYLSYFLKSHDSLENYSQIDACESFYILQSLVNLHCFDTSFEERAFVAKGLQLSDCFSVPNLSVEFAPLVHIPSVRPRCTHYPWWKIGELVSNEAKFQIVTSNANLLEFSEAALDDYLALIQNVLTPDGAFVVQCTGHTAHGSIESLLNKFWDRDFALLAMVQENVSTSPPRLGNRPDLISKLKGIGSDDVVFAVNNAILVRAGHPLFNDYRNRANFHMQFVGSNSLVERALFARPSGRRMYTIAQFVEATEETFRCEQAEAAQKLDRHAG